MSVAHWWTRQNHADRRPALLARNRIQSGMRLWLDANGFTEVDPCAMQRSPGNETHLHAFGCDAIDNDGSVRRLYLHTSPEFAMKKLLAAGEERIAAFSHVWRNRERGPLHSPEFTMLEWYRVGEDYTVLMQDCADFLAIAARRAGVDKLRYRDAECDPFAPIRRLSVADAFTQYAGIDLLASLTQEGGADADILRGQLDAIGFGHSPDDNWSDMFSRVLVALIEPELGMGEPTALDRYPAVEAALARRCADDPRVSERFELYACGVELANGFGELTDPAEQRIRFQQEMAEKLRIYGETYPIDEEFLAALAFMPEASGIALGFDRLVMLATHAPRIDSVIWAPAG